MTSSDQQRIAAELGVGSDFDVATEIDDRVQFLRDALRSSGTRSLVLGISGGIDSAVAGMLCRRATADGDGTRFIAVRLPYGQQADSADAELVLKHLQADEVHTIDVQPASDAALVAAQAAGVDFGTDAQRDFVLGNIKARQRMVVQYAIANATAGLVVGTDHAAEAITGFFTKYGDGGVDVTPLSGLTKRRVRALGARLGLPDHIVGKVPTADLETLRPQLSDEEALGLSYDQIDDFLEGRPVGEAAAAALLTRYAQTAHKRRIPASPVG
jgi:NAD+ synthase